MCGSSSHGGGQAKGAGRAATEFDGRAAVYLGAEASYRLAGCVEGDVQRMGDYDHEGGAVYSDTIPVMGRYEELEEAEDGTRRMLGRREWRSRECCWRCGGGLDDAAGCAEDEDDVGKGEAGGIDDV